VFTVHATKKLLTRPGIPQPPSPIAEDPASSPTTALGNWYATLLPWRPQVALFVNETTLLPVLTPLAPAATLFTRFPDALATVLSAHGVGESFVTHEREQMRDYRLAKTANRSVVGIMTEFTHLADAYRDGAPDPDLLTLALRLSQTPCSPLYDKHVSPDRELVALLKKSPEARP
jgi:hypothetical protein